MCLFLATIGIGANFWEMYVGGKPNTDRKRAVIWNAKNFTVHSIVKWLDSQLPRFPRLKAFFRTISPRHFVNGDWNYLLSGEAATTLFHWQVGVR